MKSKINTETYDFVREAILAAADELAKHRSLRLLARTKADKSLVTEADLASERALIQRILERFPHDTIFAEESGLSSERRREGDGVWIIDPLDGTTNFANGYPFYCISVGRGVFLADGTVAMQVGAIYDPERKHLYYAEAGCGAYLNEEPIHVAAPREFSSCFLVTGFYYARDAELQRAVDRFARVAQKCQSIRRDGSAALDMALVAAGVFDAFWEVGLQPWDVAAGSLLVQEAGGSVRNYGDQTRYHVEGAGVIAGSQSAVAEISALL